MSDGIGKFSISRGGVMTSYDVKKLSDGLRKVSYCIKKLSVGLRKVLDGLWKV